MIRLINTYQVLKVSKNRAKEREKSRETALDFSFNNLYKSIFWFCVVLYSLFFCPQSLTQTSFFRARGEDNDKRLQ